MYWKSMSQAKSSFFPIGIYRNGPLSHFPHKLQQNQNISKYPTSWNHEVSGSRSWLISHTVLLLVNITCMNTGAMVNQLQWMFPLAQQVKRPTTHQQPTERQCWKLAPTSHSLRCPLTPFKKSYMWDIQESWKRRTNSWPFLPDLSASLFPWFRSL
jgi:hypothetical protein